MKIYSMTATFGKLDGETLRLEPGLNLIAAPNEWGKSTWCAFLLAMLYGIDTKQRARQGQLPEKERYKPWSGKPMEGSLELEWQGRRITVERRSKGRIPLGEFQAFETETGLPVPELTAANCGQLLLGVERSVYQRTGFLRGGDLAVSEDEALSRRLNQLVTTGDDSPAGPALAKGLRELKNKCQYNQSGLLPQARHELAACREQLERLENLDTQAAGLEERLQDLERRKKALEHHLAALQRQEDREKLNRVEQARMREREALAELERARSQCKDLPKPAQATQNLAQWRRLQTALEALELERAMAAPAFPPPSGPDALREPGAEAEIRQRLAALTEQQEQISNLQKQTQFWVVGIALLALGLILALLLPGPWRLLGGACLTVGCITLLLAFATVRQRARRKNQLEQAQKDLLKRYGVQSLEELLRIVDHNQSASAQCQAAQQHNQSRAEALEQQRQTLLTELDALTQSRDAELFRREQTDALAAWDTWANARREAIKAKSHREAMEAVTAGLVAAPLPDTMTLPPEESRHALSKALEELTWTRSKLDACRGQRTALGDRDYLEAQAEALSVRVAQLETWQSALNYGLAALDKAQRELQRRFAPKITEEARKILVTLTDGRYDRLLLNQDLTLAAGAVGEDTLRPLLWRSDGTGDQLYLALRLAVSRILLPEAPLIFDDAFTRFDDRRLAAALDLLKQEQRQILLFTCQDREQRLLYGSKGL